MSVLIYQFEYRANYRTPPSASKYRAIPENSSHWIFLNKNSDYISVVVHVQVCEIVNPLQQYIIVTFITQ